MKRTILTLALAAAVSGLTAFGQDASPTPSASPSCPPPPHEKGWRKHHEGPGGPEGGFMRGALKDLTPAEREQFMAARKKAKNDPAVEKARKNVDAARKALMEADRAAMLKADPSIGPVLDKIAAAMKEHRPPKGEGAPKEAPEGAPEPPQ